MADTKLTPEKVEEMRRQIAEFEQEKMQEQQRAQAEKRAKIRDLTQSPEFKKVRNELDKLMGGEATYDMQLIQVRQQLDSLQNIGGV